MPAVHAEWTWTESGLVTDHVVVTDDTGLIVEVVPLQRHPQVDVRLPGHLLMPGLVNAHSHAFQRAFRGHVQHRPQGRDDFWSWRNTMYGVANGLDPEGVEAVSRLAFLEMVESGITAVGEFHYLHHQPDGTRYTDPDELAHRVIAAARSVGMRICLLRVAYERNGFEAPLQPLQRRFGGSAAEALEACERLASNSDPAVTVGLAPHSVRALSRESLGELATFVGPVHAHVSEQPAENERCLTEHGCSPTALFEEAGLLSDRFVAVHLTHPLEGDVERMQRHDAVACVCPTTELDLGDGFFPLDARSLRMCLGSDSHATIDLLAEARALELHARGLAGRRNVLTPPGDRHGLATRLLEAATVEGARALGSPSGRIVAGCPADFVALDLSRTAAVGVPPLEAAAFVATPDWVSQVWVAGQPLLEAGAHPQRRAIVEAAQAYLP